YCARKRRGGLRVQWTYHLRRVGPSGKVPVDIGIIGGQRTFVVGGFHVLVSKHRRVSCAALDLLDANSITVTKHCSVQCDFQTLAGRIRRKVDAMVGGQAVETAVVRDRRNGASSIWTHE